MILRPMRGSDLREIERLHDQFFGHEFPPVDWTHHFLSTLVVEEEGKLITVGGIRTITEIVAVTDMSLSRRKRFEGLTKLLEADVHCAKFFKYDAIHAFISDPDWEKILLKRGWQETIGKSLIKEV
jgi:hypothetical protein